MVIAQVIHRLPPINGHFKMCSFRTWCGGCDSLATICLTQCNTGLSYRVPWLIRLLPLESWSSPLGWLCNFAVYWYKWDELEHAVEREHLKHAQWVTCLVSMLAVQELGHFKLPCSIIMLQHEVMNSTTVGLSVSPWYHCEFKRSSIKYTCFHCP